MSDNQLPYGNADGALTLDQVLATAQAGVEIVMTSTLGDAQSMHSGHTPGVLFGLDGAGEVVVDG